LAFAGGVALSGVELGNFYGALILLGLGWNFGFIGATTLLASSHSPEERGRIQGMNDALVFGCVTVASLASGGLMNCSGGTPVADDRAAPGGLAPPAEKAQLEKTNAACKLALGEPGCVDLFRIALHRGKSRARIPA